MDISLKPCQGSHTQVYRVKMMQNGVNSHQRVNRGSRVHQLSIWSVDDCVSHCHPCPIQVVLTLVLVGSSSIDYTCMYVQVYVYTVYKFVVLVLYLRKLASFPGFLVWTFQYAMWRHANCTCVAGRLWLILATQVLYGRNRLVVP